MKTVQQVLNEVAKSPEGIEGYDEKNYYFRVEKEEGENWFILVYDPAGNAMYDGFWLNSQTKTLEEAVQEALEGSLLS